MKGYFSLIQYCPAIARQEAVNVGIVLLCPEVGFIEARIVSDNRRVRHCFGASADHYTHLNAMKEAVESRIEVESRDLCVLDNFRTFVASRGNKIVLTDPKPVRIKDAKADLEALYQELVRADLRFASEVE